MIHIPKICAKLLIFLLLLCMMAGVAGLSWLKAKPRTLPGMDTTLNRIIAQQGWPFKVTFKEAHTHWESWDTPLTLELRDLTVDPDSEVYSLKVPRAIVKFKMFPLLQGKVRLRNIMLSRPTLDWRINPELESQTETFTAGSYAAQWKAAQRNPVYRASLIALFRILEDPSLLPLDRLEADTATINLTLPEETRALKRDKMVLEMNDRGEGNELLFSSMELMRDTPAWLQLKVTKEAKDVLWVKANVENFSTEWIRTAAPDFSWYGNLGLIFTGEGNGFISRNGLLQQADFSLRTTPRSTLPFSVKGSIKNQPQFFTYHNIPNVELHLQIEDWAVDRFAAYWPLNLGVNARSWITQNLTNGTVHNAEASLKLPPSFWITGDVPNDALRATLPFEHMNVRVAPDLPPVTETKGTAEFSREAMRVTLQEGKLLHSTVEPGATVIIPNIGGQEVERAEIKFKLKGAVADLLSFYAVQQKKLGKELSFSEKNVKGEAVSEISMRFPLLQALKISDIDYSVHSTITNFNYADIVPKITLSDGQFTLDYKDKAMRAEGTGALNGIDSKITYLTDNKEGRKFDMDITLQSHGMAEQLPKLGFPDIPGSTGPITMDYHLKQKDGACDVVIGLNAKDTTLFYPAVGLNKPANEALSITLNLAGKGDGMPTLKSFHVDGANIKASGNSSFDDKNNLNEILFETLVFGQNDGQLKISREGEKYTLQVSAQTLNLEPLIRYYNTHKKQDKPDKTVFTLKGTSYNVLMANGEKFTGVAGDLTCLADECTSANLTAKTGDGENLTISLMQVDKERVFSANAENAGVVLRALDVIKDIRGGTLTSRATADANNPDAAYTGNVNIKDFRVAGAPILAKLLTLGSFTGILDTLNGKGMAFKKLDGRYTYGNHTYQLNDFKLYGSAIGIFTNGYVNLENSNIKLSGTLIPAYSINSAIGQVPIVGNLLGKGVLATSFTVEGKLDDPKTNVYPLSALAPGILSDFLREVGVLPSEKVKQPPAEKH